MSSRGGYSHGGRGGAGGFGRGGRGGRGGGGRMQKPPIDMNYPQDGLELGEVSHVSEDQLVVKVGAIERVPMFFRPVFLKKNQKMIGKVEEIFGPVNQHMFSVKLSEGIQASSLKKGSTIVMNHSHLMYLDRFTHPKKAAQRGLKPLNQQGMVDRRVNTGQFGFKGSRGGPRGGGGFRGGPRGRFQGRGGPRGGFGGGGRGRGFTPRGR